MVGTPSGIGQARRDLGALINALGVVGGGGSPNELRSDVGIQVQVGVEETLSRHIDLLTWESILSSRAPGVNATSALTFSFPEDVYVIDMNMWGVVTPANLEGASLLLHDPTSTPRQAIYLTTPAQETLFTGNFAPGVGVTAISHSANLVQNVLPIFVPAGTDFIYSVTADAVGGVTLALVTTVVRCPKGVPIPH